MPNRTYPISPQHVTTLVLAQSLETLWAYYSQSSGQLYEKDVRDEARKFARSLRELAEIDPRIIDPKEMQIGDASDVQKMIREIETWADGTDRFPYASPMQSRFMLFGLLSGVKIAILKKLKPSEYPRIGITSVEIEHSERVIRWKEHLPRRALIDDPDRNFSRMSETPTIAVVGDIRRSQDLMTYAPTPSSFATRMVTLTSQIRSLAEAHDGVFDKFTGDGFLVYFNEAICSLSRKDYIDCFLGFAGDALTFGRSHFEEWSRTVRKLPSEPVGLAIGADIGSIAFHDINHHLISVGDTIVWASRMASAAGAGELLVNNQLHSTTQGKSDLLFEERSCRTKSGEDFKAWRLSFGPRSVPKQV